MITSASRFGRLSSKPLWIVGRSQCSKQELQEFRSSGVLGYWGTGVLGYWSAGVMECTGVLEYWSTGVGRQGNQADRHSNDRRQSASEGDNDASGTDLPSGTDNAACHRCSAVDKQPHSNRHSIPAACRQTAEQQPSAPGSPLFTVKVSGKWNRL